MDITHRPAVRIVCLDNAARVLLLRWRDPYDGALLWEPPGGGIEDGETPYRAACRELTEETGIDAELVRSDFVTVARDVRWNGKRFAGPEQFFVAWVPAAQPALSRSGLMPDERVNLAEHGWFTVEGLADIDRLEPPNLSEVIAELTA